MKRLVSIITVVMLLFTAVPFASAATHGGGHIVTKAEMTEAEYAAAVAELGQPNENNTTVGVMPTNINLSAQKPVPSRAPRANAGGAAIHDVNAYVYGWDANQNPTWFYVHTFDGSDRSGTINNNGASFVGFDPNLYWGFTVDVTHQLTTRLYSGTYTGGSTALYDSYIGPIYNSSLGYNYINATYFLVDDGFGGTFTYNGPYPQSQPSCHFII